jgi:hypothetical protein
MIERVGPPDDACVVDKDIDRTELLFEISNHALGRFFVESRQVRFERHAAAAKFCDLEQRVVRRAAVRRQRHIRTEGGAGHCDRGADSGRAPCDKRPPSRERE